MATIVLKTCDNSIEASLIKGMLENNGIMCFLTNENFSSLMPQFNGMLGAGVQIIIDEADLDKAQKLIAAQTFGKEIFCPACNSANVSFGLGRRKSNRILAILLSLFAGAPFGNIRNIYYCKDCKTEFKNN